MKRPKPVCLIIMDGWGISDAEKGNAIKQADTPNIDKYKKTYPNTILNSSGEAVGLPEGQMGNSEVGHLNIGAGRVIYQEFTRISRSIRNKDFFENKVLIGAMDNVKQKGSSLHLMGLVSDGGVHSHLDHLKALVDLSVSHNIKNIYIHAFLDGRDVPPRSALPYLQDLKKHLEDNGRGEIATVSGRYYAMDRDNRWDRTKKAYDALVYRQGERYPNIDKVIEKSYERGIDDEFVIPSIIDVKDEQKAKVKSGDSIIFFNFRPDRARQLTRAFINDEFDAFHRGPQPPKTYYVTMTQYDKEFDVPVAYPPKEISNTLGEVLSKNGLKQLRIAETEKYAHVTFFFNGGVEKAFKDEDRILIPSPKVPTYDLKPEMSACEVTDKLIEILQKDVYDVIILNYANADMVGHTGKIEKAIKAIEAVDRCVGRVVEQIRTMGGVAVITADHGNAEEMYDEEKMSDLTQHSVHPVPFILCSNDFGQLRQSEDKAGGCLCDIAPTVLGLLGIDKPEEMTGKSLIKE